MSLQNGDLNSRLTLDFRQFTQGLRTAGRQARDAARELQRSFREGTQSLNDTSNATRTVSSDFRDLEKIVGGILLSQAFYASVTAIKEATNAVLEFTGNMEKAQISFEYFLGSSERAAGFIENMKDFSAETAFNTEQAMALSKKLLNAGFEAEKVREIMERLNDTAAVAGMSPAVIDRIVLAFTQMKTSGKIMGTEMRQLAEANIPVYKILQEQLGLTGDEMKNIGDLKIDSDVGIAAIFAGLEQFDGAAFKVAQTMSGMMETIQDNALIMSEKIFAKPYAALKSFVGVVRDTMEEARAHLTEGGLGAVLENMVPPELQDTIRLVAGSLLSLGRSFIDWHKAMWPVVQVLMGGLFSAMSIILPIIANLAREVVTFAQSALAVVPPLKYLIAAIGGLLIANVAAKSLMLLWGVTRLGVIATAVAGAVMKLYSAIRILAVFLLAHPLVAGITIIGGALLWLAMQTKVVSDWVDRLMAGLASLGGFNIDKILQPESLGTNDYMAEFNEQIDSLDTALAEAGETGEEAGDKIKKSFLAAFDEVFQVPEPEEDAKEPETNGGGGLPSLGEDKGETPQPIDIPRKIELPKLEWPEIPPFPPFPPFPPLPPLPQIQFAPIQVPSFAPVITAFGWAMDRIRVGVGEFGNWMQQAWQTTWEVMTYPLPSWEIIAGGLGAFGDRLAQIWQTTLEIMSYPMPAWGQGLLGGLGTIGDAVTGALGAFGDALAAVWQSTLEIMTFPMPAWADNVITTITTLAPMALPLLALFGEQAVTSLQNAWNTSVQAVSTWGSNVATTIGEAGLGWGLAIAAAVAPLLKSIEQFGTATFKVFEMLWPEIQKTMSNFGSAAWDIMKGVGESLVQFWEDHKVTILLVVGGIIAAIVLFFTGLPAGVIAAIVTLVARVGPAFARMGPAIMNAIRSIPGGINKLWSKLPDGVQTAVMKMADKFKALPGLIWEAIKGIPGKVGEVFGNIKIPSFSQIGTSITGSFSKLGDVAGFAGGGIIGNDSIVRVGEKGRREAIVPLQNDTAMAPFVNSVVKGLSGMNFGNGNNNSEPAPPIIYVQHLIADDRGLKELERKMQVIRVNEAKRGGGRG